MTKRYGLFGVLSTFTFWMGVLWYTAYYNGFGFWEWLTPVNVGIGVIISICMGLVWHLVLDREV